VRRARPRSGRHGGILFKLLVVLVALSAVLALAWMLFLPLVLTTQLRRRTGFDATVQSLAVNPFTGRVALRGLVLTNPPAFPDREFVEVREFSAGAEVFSLLSDRLVFTFIDVDVAGLTLVKCDNGQANTEVFRRNLTQAPASPTQPSAAAPPRRFLIRRLTVRFDRLVIIDHTGRQPASRDYRLGLNHTYTNVSDPSQLFAPAVLQSLGPVGEALDAFVPGRLGRTLTDTLKGAAKSGAGFLKEAGRKAGEKVKEYFDALEESRKP
jgi:uncharacterized protein involved in outer membrane biogenesis